MKNRPYSITLSKVCRLCFEEKTALSPIFDNKSIPDLTLKIQQCVSVEVSDEDQLPTQICDDCCREISNWINFKKKCNEADTNLKDYVRSVQVKEESGENIESVTVENCSNLDARTLENPSSTSQHDQITSDQIPTTVTSDTNAELDNADRSTQNETIQSSEKSSHDDSEIRDETFVSSEDPNRENTVHHQNGTPLTIEDDPIHFANATDDDISQDVVECESNSLKESVNQEVSLALHTREVDDKTSTLSSHSHDQTETNHENVLFFVDCDLHYNVSKTEIKNVCDTVENDENVGDQMNDSFNEKIHDELLLQSSEDEVEVSCRSSDSDACNENVACSSSNNIISCAEDAEEILTEIESNTIDELAKEAQRGCLGTSQSFTNGNCPKSNDECEDFEEISIEIDLDAKTELVNLNHRKNNTTNKTLKKPFSCGKCDRTFDSRRGLRIHEKSKWHGRRRLGLGSGPLKFKCDKCEFRAKHKHNLVYHIQSRHTSSTVCPTCGKVCDNYMVLKNHRQRHHTHPRASSAGKKVYTCNICQKRISHKTTLKAHIRNHSFVHKCKHCGKGFASEVGLHLHERFHTSKPILKCDKCDFTARIRRVVNDHMLSQHGTEGSIGCHLCGECFTSKSSLLVHRRQVHDGCKRSKSEPMVCNDCQKSFWSRDSLKQHIHVRHIREPSPCNICDKTFKNKFYLKMHIKKSHISSKEYTCEICDYKCKTKTRLQDHFRVHIGGEQFVCGACGRSFSHKSSLQNHQRTHEETGEFVCDHCQKSFRLKVNLREHIIKSHTYKYKCEKCDKRFPTEAEFYSHDNTHTADGKMVPPKKYVCEICGRACRTEFHLVSHQRVHTEPSRCNLCEKTFSSRDRLRYHVLTHGGDEKLPCEVCGKTCPNKFALNSHRKRIHETQKVFACEICDYGCRSLQLLTDHFNKHTGEKPYCCEICNVSYSTKNALKAHKGSYHSAVQASNRSKLPTTHQRPTIVETITLD